MGEQLWFTVLFTVAMGGAWALLRHGDAPPASEAGGLVFRYPVGVAYLGDAFLIVGAVFVGWMAVALSHETPQDWVGLAIVSAFFAAPGLWFVVAYRREWARLTTDGVEVQGTLGSEPKRTRWAAVERVSFGRFSGALVFRTADGRTLRVSGLFQGTPQLAEVVSRRLPDRGGIEAARDLLTYRQQAGG